MNKKKVLICSHAMEIGGAERSLLDLLHNFDYEKYDLDLFLYRHSGEWMNAIPDKTNLLPEDKKYASLLLPMKELPGLKQYDVLLLRMLGKALAAVYRKKNSHRHSAVGIEYSHKFTRFCMPQISKNQSYDLAVSFLTPHYFVSEKVKAACKIAWIHTDYSTVEINEKSEWKMWAGYDHIVSISEDCTRAFLKKFPDLSDKIVEIENILSDSWIREKSEESISDSVFDVSCMKLLSVGRFSDAKNFENVPEICRLLCEKNINLRWYLIGYGGKEQLIRRRISEAGMEDHVFILGKKENPYPYIRNCDVYLQPSRYEGKSVAVREAQILAKPVIVTEYPTAASQVRNGFDGIIVPMDNEGCAAGIYKVLTDPGLMEKLAGNCLKNDYTNSKEIEKIYHLMN